MAYTSAPEAQTNSSERIPLVVDLDIRPSSPQNPGMINIVPFKEKETLYGETRHYIQSMAAIASSGLTTSSAIRNIYVWEKDNNNTYYYYIIANRVYSSTTGTSFGLVTTFTSTTPYPVGITEFIDSTNTKKLVMVDGLEGYVFTDNTAGTKISDVDFPSPHVPTPVFLDGYLFLAKQNTGDIYNSDLDDPALWTAGSFISSEVYPDDIKALVKVDNYLLAVGKQGSEFFYDAANATASPLARVDGGILPFGTSFPYTIAKNKDTVTMIADRNDGNPVLVKIDGLKFTELGDTHGVLAKLSEAVIAGYLNSTTPYYIPRGMFIRQREQLLYILNFGNGTLTAHFDATKCPTYAYSFNTGMWTEFQYNGGPYSVYASHPSSGTASTFVGLKTSLSASGFVFCRLREGSTSANATDYSSVAIAQEIRTPVYTFDTMNTKFMNRFGLAVEASAAAYTSGATFAISVSDDLYNTWSSVGSVSLSNAGATSGNIDYPFITQLGRFRQRAFKISMSGYFCRYHFAETDINKGQQ